MIMQTDTKCYTFCCQIDLYYCTLLLVETMWKELKVQKCGKYGKSIVIKEVDVSGGQQTHPIGQQMDWEEMAARESSIARKVPATIVVHLSPTKRGLRELRG